MKETNNKKTPNGYKKALVIFIDILGSKNRSDFRELLNNKKSALMHRNVGLSLDDGKFLEILKLRDVPEFNEIMKKV